MKINWIIIYARKHKRHHWVGFVTHEGMVQEWFIYVLLCVQWQGVFSSKMICIVKCVCVVKFCCLQAICMLCFIIEKFQPDKRNEHIHVEYISFHEVFRRILTILSATQNLMHVLAFATIITCLNKWV